MWLAALLVLISQQQASFCRIRRDISSRRRPPPVYFGLMCRISGQSACRCDITQRLDAAAGLEVRIAAVTNTDAVRRHPQRKRDRQTQGHTQPRRENVMKSRRFPPAATRMHSSRCRLHDTTLWDARTLNFVTFWTRPTATIALGCLKTHDMIITKCRM